MDFLSARLLGLKILPQFQLANRYVVPKFQEDIIIFFLSFFVSIGNINGLRFRDPGNEAGRKLEKSVHIC